MKKQDTYIKMSRGVLENEVFNMKPFDDWRAFEYLLYTARVEPYDLKLKTGETVHLDRGQCFEPRAYLAEVFGWTTEELRAFEKRMAKRGMVQAEGTRRGVIYTVTNFCKYQDLLGVMSLDAAEGENHKEPQSESPKNPKQNGAKTPTRNSKKPQTENVGISTLSEEKEGGNPKQKTGKTPNRKRGKPQPESGKNPNIVNNVYINNEVVNNPPLPPQEGDPSTSSTLSTPSTPSVYILDKDNDPRSDLRSDLSRDLSPDASSLKGAPEPEATGEGEESPELAEALEEYAQYRKEIKKPLTKTAVKRMRMKLERIAPGDPKTQAACLWQSIDMGWVGVFELKSGGQRKEAKKVQDPADRTMHTAEGKWYAEHYADTVF